MPTPTTSFILGLSSLKAYWPLDASDPTDELIAGLDQTFYGSPTTGVDMGFTAGDTGVQFASASSQYARRSHNAAFNFGTGDGSIAFWAIIPSSDATVRYLVAHDGDGEGGSWDLKHTNSLLQSRFAGVTPGNSSFTPNSSVKFIVWNFDRDGNAVRYIDGSSTHSASISSGSAVDVSVNNDLFFARRYNAGTPGYANVTLAHVVLRGALWTPTEMTNAMAARLNSGSVNATAGTTSGTGLASSPTPRVRPSAGHAAATGAAHQPPMPIYAQAGHATADGWASQGEGAELDVDPATIEATAAAGAASAAVAVPIGHASATGAAQAPTAGLGAPAGIASFNATAEAHDATAEVVAPTVIAEHATATGAASDATPGLSLPAEHLAATAEASGIGASVAVSPSVASATGAAQTATATVPGVAGTAMVQAAAQTPSTSVKANAGHASASASAEAVAIAMAVYPAAASAIAAAYPLQAAVVASAGIAQATGATYDIRPPFDWDHVHVYLNPAPAPSAVLGPAPAPSAVMGDT